MLVSEIDLGIIISCQKLDVLVDEIKLFDAEDMIF